MQNNIGVFRGVTRMPKPGATKASYANALGRAQEVEDIFCQVLDGDIGLSEAFDRYLAIEVEGDPAPSVNAVVMFTESLTGKVAR